MVAFAFNARGVVCSGFGMPGKARRRKRMMGPVGEGLGGWQILEGSIRIAETLDNEWCNHLKGTKPFNPTLTLTCTSSLS